MKNKMHLTLLYPEDLTDNHFIDDMFDSAITGVTHDWRVMYSSEKCIDIIAKEISKYKGVDPDDEDIMLEATECFDHNYGCAYWKDCPIYIWTLAELKRIVD